MLILLLLLLFSATVSSSPNFAHRQELPKEYLELGQPLPSDGLKLEPSCTARVLDNDFGNTTGSPPISVPYSLPSDCPSPWSYVVLEFHATCRGQQHDRIAALWLGGAEILRTSTARPTQSGIFWTVRKDVTRYSALLARSDLNLSMMLLENVVDDVFTGVYHVGVSLLYYHPNTDGAGPKVAADVPEPERFGFGLDDISHVPSFHPPADWVVPITGEEDQGFWFRVNGGWDVHRKKLDIPPNTRRAVLEIYASFHGDDEFWYSNPPDSYINMNNLSTQRGHGAFREVYVAVDGNLVTAEVVFPVIFAGGINPLLWEPVAAIGAFNLPCYEMELTPFLGLLLDGKSHEFWVGVTHSVPFWLVGANLHLWLDPRWERVQAATVVHEPPRLWTKCNSRFKLLDGSFRIRAERKIEATGWVQWSAGNFTTHVAREMRFKSSLRLRANGTRKWVRQNMKARSQVKVVSSETGTVVGRTDIKKSYPLKVVMMNTLPAGSDEDTTSMLVITNVSHAFKESVLTKSSSSRGRESKRRTVSNSQDLWGWMAVKDDSVVSGAAETRQSLSCKGGSTCYLRSVEASNGRLVRDESSASCDSSW